MKHVRLPAAFLVAFATAPLSACDDGGAPSPAPAADAATTPVPPAVDFGRDVLTTDLQLDLAALTGRARITLAPSATSTSASFQTKGLTITSVTGPDGPLEYAVTDGRLDVGLPAGTTAPALDVAYSFTTHGSFDGYLPAGLTFLWPYFCSNLFPCKPDPDDGVRFSLEVTGGPAGKTAVFPAAIPGDAPSYMLGLAFDDFTRVDLGTTTAGTAVHLWHRPGEETTAVAATVHLKDAFDWLERTYGAYSFGNDVGSVSANWGPGGFGGMEHHPYWHVASSSIGSTETHMHEAAHGWFGNGVRMACWEDFVLSEGTSSYLAARAIEETDSVAAGDAIWAEYERRLETAELLGDTAAWPDGCNDIDILNDRLWSSIPYMKGAFFLRAVEAEIGRAKLDEVLRTFYAAHVGQAASMQELVDSIQAVSGFDAMPLATAWLKGLGHP